ncbi:MAG: ABC transporter substrate-binding protein [Clostridia bacterium]|nr:ABC transporter substrate-binding protein [Clostridia bacterium]
MKRFLCFIISLSVLILSAGCGGQKLTSVRVNEVTHSIFYAPLYIAVENGYFEDEGIEIELTNGGGADKSMAALLSGSADVAFCGPEAAIYVINEGKADAPKVFGQLTKRDGSFLVGRTADDDFAWEKLENKTVIAGRTGGVPAMTFEYVVNKHGLFNGRNITLDNSVQFNLMGPSFEGGNGDYVTLFEPTASEFQKAGKGYIVASVGEESGEIPYTAFMSLTSYITKNRDVLVRFLTAVQRAVDHLRSTPLSTVAEEIKGQFPDTPTASITASLESYLKIDAWMTDMSMTETSLNRLQDVMTAAGELEKRVSLSALTDNTIAKEVYEKAAKNGG